MTRKRDYANSKAGSTLLGILGRQEGAEGSLKRFHLARQAINSQQQGATKGDSSNLVGYGLAQGKITPWADSTAELKPCLRHQCHGQPEVATLNFGLDFTPLHLLQVQLALADEMTVKGLAMHPSSSPPLFDHALIQAEGFDDSLLWIAISQQDDNAHDDFWVCAQSIEQSAFDDGKCLTANGTAASLFLLDMDTKLPSPVASRRTVDIGAKQVLQVHCVSLSPTGFGFANFPVCIMNLFCQFCRF